MAYAATFDVTPPQTFDKAQVVLRILIIIVIAVLQVGNIIFGGMYLILPVVAAVMIAQKGAEKYHEEAEGGPVRWLRYLIGFYSYMALASDKMPFEHPEDVNLKVQPTGTPTVGSALLRIILAIPHAIVLFFVGIAFAVVWLIAAISILIGGTYPEWAQSFIRGYLRWNARLFAYLASLVDEYPPFSFQNGEAAPAPSAPPAAPPTSEPPAQPSGGEAPSLPDQP
jgi:hypothetical protein